MTPTGGKLGKWCSHRRDERKAGRLSAERVAALDALGFVWDPLQQVFDSGYPMSQETVARNRAPISAHVESNRDGHISSMRRLRSSRGEQAFLASESRVRNQRPTGGLANEF